MSAEKEKHIWNVDPENKNYNAQKEAQRHREKQMNPEEIGDWKIAEYPKNIKISVFLMHRVTMNEIASVKQDHKIQQISK